MEHVTPVHQSTMLAVESINVNMDCSVTPDELLFSVDRALLFNTDNLALLSMPRPLQLNLPSNSWSFIQQVSKQQRNGTKRSNYKKQTFDCKNTGGRRRCFLNVIISISTNFLHRDVSYKRLKTLTISLHA